MCSDFTSWWAPLLLFALSLGARSMTLCQYCQSSYVPVHRYHQIMPHQVRTYATCGTITVDSLESIRLSTHSTRLTIETKEAALAMREILFVVANNRISCVTIKGREAKPTEDTSELIRIESPSEDK